MRISIRGKFWNLNFVPNLGKKDGERIFGLCSSPEEKNKTIKIWQGAKDEELISTIIHETLHASGWNLDEEFVDKFGDDCARLLWKLGYRKIE